MADRQKQGKGGTKKHGRTARSPAKARYNGEMRWIRNKRKKLTAHVRRFPADRQAARCLEAL